MNCENCGSEVTLTVETAVQHKETIYSGKSFALRIVASCDCSVVSPKATDELSTVEFSGEAPEGWV